MSQVALTIVSDLGIGGTQRVAEVYAGLYQDLGMDSVVLTTVGSGPREASLRRIGIGVIDGWKGEDYLRRAASARPEVIHIHRHGGAEQGTAELLDLLDPTRAARVIETNVFGRPDYTLPPGRITMHGQVSLWSQWRWESWGRWLPGDPCACLLPNVVPPRINGLDPAEFRNRLGIPSSAFLVGRIGQPNESKWSVHTVEAFRRFAGVRDDAWLLVVGPPPSIRRAVMQLPDPIGRRVRVMEAVHDDALLAGAYAAMDVFLHSSRIGESFGMVLVESMLQKTPVVTLSTPEHDNGQVEVVGDKIGGRVALDVDGLLRYLIHFYEDRSALAVAGESGARRTAELYGVDRVRRRLQSIVEVVGHESEAAVDLAGDGLESQVLDGVVDDEFPSPAGLVESHLALLPAWRSRWIRARHHPATYLATHGRDARSWLSKRGKPIQN